MTRAAMLQELKTILHETSVDAAWGDTLLLSYMAEGQDKFCEETGYFVDSTNYTFTLVEGQHLYALDERIIKVKSVLDGARMLGKFQETDRYKQDFYAQTFPSDTSSSPYAWETDKDTGSLTLYTPPTAEDAGDVYAMRVWRYSRYALNNNDIVGDDTGVTAEPEIPQRFHRACVHWAAYKAMTHHDFEQQDSVKARDHKMIFEEYIANGKTAFENIRNARAQIAPSPIYTVR